MKLFLFFLIQFISFSQSKFKGPQCEVDYCISCDVVGKCKECSEGYYISKGILGISKETNKIFTVLRGDFFGEVDCILEKNRDSDAIAFTDCEIVKINKDTFLFLIQKNPEAAIKALYHIKSYFSKIYGLTE